MKANELRIGNYLLFRGKEYKISSINDDNTVRFRLNLTGFKKAICSWGTTLGCYFLRDEDIKPIPLTEEWLLKFGFYENEFGCFEKVQLIIKVEKNKPVPYLETNYKHIWIQAVDFKHVHQLQNLYFALTGKELKYEE